MDQVWREYHCKSGETIFLYNKATGEHRWPNDLGPGVEGKIIYSRPVEYKEYRTIAIQTVDYGCNNGCMSMYINTEPSPVCNTSNVFSSQKQCASYESKPVVASTSMYIDTDPNCVSNASGTAVYQQQCASDGSCLNIELAAASTSGHRDEQQTESQAAFLNEDALEKHLMKKSHGHRNQNSINSSKNTLRDTDNIDHNNTSNVAIGNNINNDDDEYDDMNHSKSENFTNNATHPQDTELRRAFLENTEFSSEIPVVADEHNNSNENKNEGSTKVCIVNNATESLEDGQPNHNMDLEKDSNVPSNSRPMESKSDNSRTTFTQAIAANTPIDVHNFKRRFECSSCNKVFSRHDLLCKHRSVHSGKQSHECIVCAQTFSLKSNLNRHMLIHLGVKPFECTVCKKRFTQKVTLIDHVATHTGEKAYECPDCDKKFTQRGGLRCHARVHHKSFECSVCSMKFEDENGLQEHTKEHVTQFECSVCKEKFDDKVSLCKHAMSVHVGKLKSYECTVCKKSFSTSGNLRRHVLIHVGLKPFECNVCHKTFSQNSSLNVHYRTHGLVVKTPQFKCCFCKKPFHTKEEYCQHLDTHRPGKS